MREILVGLGTDTRSTLDWTWNWIAEWWNGERKGMEGRKWRLMYISSILQGSDEGKGDVVVSMTEKERKGK